MDVNGVRFHLLLGESDWRPLLESGSAQNLRWDSATNTVSLRPELMRFPPRVSEPRLTPADRRGAGCDAWCTAFWIDEEQTAIRYSPSGSREAADFWTIQDLFQRCEPEVAAGEFRPVTEDTPRQTPLLRGLAVTTEHYLVVGTLRPGGLLIFDLHGGGPPVWQRWPDSIEFEPFDLAPSCDGGVWILDRGSETRFARLWKLNRRFCVEPTSETVELVPAQTPEFRAVGGTARERPAVTFPAGVTLGLSSPLQASTPVAIIGLSGGSVLILDSDPLLSSSYVHLYRAGVLRDSVELDRDLLSELLDINGILGHDFAFVSDPGPPAGVVSGQLTVVADDGNQAFVFQLELDRDRLSLRLLPRYAPLRRFSGKALIICGGQVHYDLEERWMPVALQPRRRYEVRGGVQEIVLDGKLPDTVWHRLTLDACIPNGTSIEVASRTANELDLLGEMPWRTEPVPYRRAEGSELPFELPFGDSASFGEGVGTWETLFQTATGRYLELRLRLNGNGRASPHIRALRAWYPRFSYLKQYLPAVYREEPVSASFLDRYLSNVEGLFTTLEGRIERAQLLFDSRTSPREYLDWLLSWLGDVFNPDWEDSRRRLFLANAVLLFRWRGTVPGLRAMIRIAIDPCPDQSIFDELQNPGESPCAPVYSGSTVRIVEQFLQRKIPIVAVGDPETTSELLLTSESEEWRPEFGAGPLHQRYREFLQTRYSSPGNLNSAWGTSYTSFSQVRLSPVVPAEAAAAADWREFTNSRLGFEYYPVTSASADTYRRFLQHRYGTLEPLNNAYQLTGTQRFTSFSGIQLPGESEFPEGSRRLYDWIQFVSQTLPLNEAAHRFTVLVPFESGETGEAQTLRLAKVEQVVKREKPSHTAFQVLPFWALFQAGTARLGVDTVLGESSRYSAMVLGSGYLGNSLVGASHPWNVRERFVIGRDPHTEN